MRARTQDQPLTRQDVERAAATGQAWARKLRDPVYRFDRVAQVQMARDLVELARVTRIVAGLPPEPRE